MKKEIVLLLKIMTETTQLYDMARKPKGDVFRRVLSSEYMTFQDGGFKVSLHDCKCIMRNCVQFESRQV